VCGVFTVRRDRLRLGVGVADAVLNLAEAELVGVYFRASQLSTDQVSVEV